MLIAEQEQGLAWVRQLCVHSWRHTGWYELKTWLSQLGRVKMQPMLGGMTLRGIA